MLKRSWEGNNICSNFNFHLMSFFIFRREMAHFLLLLRDPLFSCPLFTRKIFHPLVVAIFANVSHSLKEKWDDSVHYETNVINAGHSKKYICSKLVQYFPYFQVFKWIVTCIFFLICSISFFFKTPVFWMSCFFSLCREKFDWGFVSMFSLVSKKFFANKKIYDGIAEIKLNKKFANRAT